MQISHIPVVWPDNPFRKNRDCPAKPIGITCMEYAAQHGLSKTAAHRRLVAMVENGKAIRKEGRLAAGKMGRVVYYTFKEEADDD